MSVQEQALQEPLFEELCGALIPEQIELLLDRTIGGHLQELQPTKEPVCPQLPVHSTSILSAPGADNPPAAGRRDNAVRDTAGARPLRGPHHGSKRVDFEAGSDVDVLAGFLPGLPG